MGRHDLSTLTSTHNGPLTLMRHVRNLICIIRVMRQILRNRMVPITEAERQLIRVTMLRNSSINVRRLKGFLSMSLTRYVLNIMTFYCRRNEAIRSSITRCRSLLGATLKDVLNVRLLLSRRRVLFEGVHALRHFRVARSERHHRRLTHLSRFYHRRLRERSRRRRRRFRRSRFRFRFLLSVVCLFFLLSWVIPITLGRHSPPRKGNGKGKRGRGVACYGNGSLFLSNGRGHRLFVVFTTVSIFFLEGAELVRVVFMFL